MSWSVAMMVAPFSASVASVQVPRPEKELWCVQPVWWEMLGASINMPSGRVLEACVDGSEDSALLAYFRGPFVEGGRDVKVPVMFSRVVRDEVGSSLGPFALDMVEVPVVGNLRDVEDSEREDPTGMFTVGNKFLVDGGV
eukprot:7085241-Heterocapsa_arctica.AAC.1